MAPVGETLDDLFLREQMLMRELLKSSRCIVYLASGYPFSFASSLLFVSYFMFLDIYSVLLEILTCLMSPVTLVILSVDVGSGLAP